MLYVSSNIQTLDEKDEKDGIFYANGRVLIGEKESLYNIPCPTSINGLVAGLYNNYTISTKNGTEIVPNEENEIYIILTSLNGDYVFGR